MRWVVLVLVLTVGLGGAAARAQDAGAEIRGVISDQIAALQADDFDTAFGFASPAIKRLFGSSDRFGQMVRSGYPMVWRPADVRFADLADRDGRTVQSVVVTDQAGVPYVVDYEMIPMDGGWRINGVWVRKDADAGA